MHFQSQRDAGKLCYARSRVYCEPALIILSFHQAGVVVLLSFEQLSVLLGLEPMVCFLFQLLFLIAYIHLLLFFLSSFSTTYSSVLYSRLWCLQCPPDHPTRWFVQEVFSRCVRSAAGGIGQQFAYIATLVCYFV